MYAQKSLSDQRAVWVCIEGSVTWLEIQTIGFADNEPSGDPAAGALVATVVTPSGSAQLLFLAERLVAVQVI
ncbi:MAG TPA: hypothetical protein VM711_07380 [Sphingomicrobium sp.]|nr:hypothetical protein [Sphingomicrobium sp.]